MSDAPLSFVEGAFLKYSDRAAESGALHALFVLEDQRAELFKKAPPAAYFFESSKRAARALLAMHQKDEPFTRAVFVARLRGDDAETIATRIMGGLRLDDGSPLDATGNLARYADDVRRQWQSRERIRQAAGLLAAAEDGDDDQYLAELRAIHAKAATEDEAAKPPPLFGDAVFTVSESDEANPWGLIEGAIPSEGRMLLVAPPSTGKTMFCAELALSAALPEWKPFGCFPRASDEPMNTLMFSLEDRRANMRRRLEALLRGRDLDENAITPELREALKRIRIEDTQSVGGALTLSEPKSFALVENAIREHKPKLVIFDNVGKIRGGANENAASDMEAAVFGPLDDLYGRFGGLFVLVHHTGLALRKGGMAARGTSSFEAWADSRWAWVDGEVNLKSREDSPRWPALRKPFQLELVNNVDLDGTVFWSGSLQCDPSRSLSRGAKKLFDRVVTSGSLSFSERKTITSNGTKRKEWTDELVRKGFARLHENGTLEKL